MPAVGLIIYTLRVSIYSTLMFHECVVICIIIFKQFPAAYYYDR